LSDSAVLPSSPESQPITRSLCRGSGRSQSKHWNVRSPFPSGGSAKTSRAPHRGHVGRSASPIPQILPLLRIFVNQNVQRISWFQRRNTILALRCLCAQVAQRSGHIEAVPRHLDDAHMRPALRNRRDRQGRARPRPCGGADRSRVAAGGSNGAQRAAQVISLSARCCRSLLCPLCSALRTLVGHCARSGSQQRTFERWIRDQTRLLLRLRSADPDTPPDRLVRRPRFHQHGSVCLA